MGKQDHHCTCFRVLAGILSKVWGIDPVDALYICVLPDTCLTFLTFGKS